jgi:hypothetical protein
MVNGMKFTPNSLASDNATGNSKAAAEAPLRAPIDFEPFDPQAASDSDW